MERRAPRVGLLDSHVARGPDGRLVFVGMSAEAARLAFAHAGAWFRFRQARRAGDFDGMLAAELRAEAVLGPLTTRLQAEGFGGEEIAALLAQHRRNDSGDPERGQESGYCIALGAKLPPIRFRFRHAAARNVLARFVVKS